VVTGSFDLEVGVTTYDIADGHEALEQKRDRIGFGMRIDKPHEITHDAVEGGIIDRIWPSGRPPSEQGGVTAREFSCLVGVWRNGCRCRADFRLNDFGHGCLSVGQIGQASPLPMNWKKR
jgi:hypothetical protein